MAGTEFLTPIYCWVKCRVPGPAKADFYFIEGVRKIFNGMVWRALRDHTQMCSGVEMAEFSPWLVVLSLAQLWDLWILPADKLTVSAWFSRKDSDRHKSLQ